MPTPIITTKLAIPSPRTGAILRPQLIERLNEGLHRKLTLISAPAGFGKTTLAGEWVAGCGRPVAWLSLDEGDGDPARFLTYLVAALQTIAPHIGAGVQTVLQSPQPPSAESILAALLNEIAAGPMQLTLVLDDYHAVDARPVDAALAFLVEHLPPQIHLVIATREDPQLPLARLRARGQLAELRAKDVRFALSEAAAFLNEAMGLNLTAEEVAALNSRTEGWIAGLQLAALSLQGHQDASSFIRSFTGNHHFVLDYLVEEVLHQQPERIQTFLLRTSILERLCGPLCDALLLDPSSSGQETLESIERANLFIIPLDSERRWYRYHHLFADLLRQRQHTASSPEGVAELHRRASIWYEKSGLELEAFHHAVASNDVDLAARLAEGAGMPLHFRGAAASVLKWLKTLPATALDARPSLWVIYASALLFASEIAGVEQKLQAAEAALQDAEPDDTARDLIGHIAAIRATLAVSRHDRETILTQSHRALEYLHPDNLPVRTATTWTLGYAYHLQGERAAASEAYREALSASQTIGHFIITLLSTIGLGNMQEAENQLGLAAQTYQRALQLAGEPPLPVVCEAYLGLARISYEWNDLDTAQQYGQQALQLARQLETTDSYIGCEVFLARLRLARGDVAGAATLVAQASQSVRQQRFVYRAPEVAAAQVLLLLRQGNLEAAAHLAQAHRLPISQARLHLTQGDISAALAALEAWRQRVDAKGWEDEQLRVMVLQAETYHAHGQIERAVGLLGEVLALAEPGGFIRTFVDEGPPMTQLLSEAAARGMMPDYLQKLLAASEAEGLNGEGTRSPALPGQPFIEPLSQRELHVLRLIAQGLSNREIGARLSLALDTVKGHTRRIFGKLHVQRRTEAIARARELGLL